ncbi:hypothetical protein HYDPIDRAFT_25970 [Hydnomerulius pinastri MD-312]|nr:hypothetical protein HYDPIDRAFT_25970 [Hydnomerulius pinastri MD-312]
MTPHYPPTTGNRRTRLPYARPGESVPPSNYIGHVQAPSPPDLQFNPFDFEFYGIRPMPSSFDNIVSTYDSIPRTFHPTGLLPPIHPPAPLNANFGALAQLTDPPPYAPYLRPAATSQSWNLAQAGPVGQRYADHSQRVLVAGGSSVGAFSGGTHAESSSTFPIELQANGFPPTTANPYQTASSWYPSYSLFGSEPQASLPPHNPQGPVAPQPATSTVTDATLIASYLCLWTERGAVCNTRVLGTRLRMNRHLHTDHQFGGSDTRKTTCYWEGCSAQMQQGSIARHIVARHMHAKVLCPDCSKELSRGDVITKHRPVCPKRELGTKP